VDSTKLIDQLEQVDERALKLAIQSGQSPSTANLFREQAWRDVLTILLTRCEKEEASADRITPYKEGGNVEQRIDEIVALDAKIHIEMMSGQSAWMRIGNDIFWIEARKNSLFIRYSYREGGE
jgi:hypothetical protein